MTTSIALYDHDCHLDPKILQNLAKAATIWVNRDLAQPSPHGWGVTAYVRVITNLLDAHPGEWICGFFGTPDVADALGWHDALPDGTPRLVIYPLLLDPSELGIVVTHEIGEALCDPEINRTAVGTDGVVRALEVGDPVERDSYTIKIGHTDVAVSDWCTPLYFEPPSDLTNAKFDYLGNIKAPFEIRPGGYQIIYKDGEWQQEVNGTLSAYRQMMLEEELGRLAKRIKVADAQPALK